MDGFPVVNFPRHMTPNQFLEMFRDFLEFFNDVTVVEADDRAVGWILGQGNDKEVSPHTAWLPWSTPRQQLEGMARYLEETNRRKGIIVRVPDTEKRTMEHFQDMGLLRRVGTLHHSHIHDSKVLLFEGVPR